MEIRHAKSPKIFRSGEVLESLPSERTFEFISGGLRPGHTLRISIPWPRGRIHSVSSFRELAVLVNNRPEERLDRPAVNYTRECIHGSSPMLSLTNDEDYKDLFVRRGDVDGELVRDKVFLKISR